MLSQSDVEDVIVDFIECLAEDYQFFEWKPVSLALKHLDAVVQARLRNEPDPVKPFEHLREGLR